MKVTGYAITLMGAMAGDSEHIMAPLLLIMIGVMLILADMHAGGRK